MGTRTLDDKDRQLIALLRANARQPAALLARKLGLSRSAVQEALDEVLTRIGKLPGVTRTTSSILLSSKFERR